MTLKKIIFIFKVDLLDIKSFLFYIFIQQIFPTLIFYLHIVKRIFIDILGWVWFCMLFFFLHEFVTYKLALAIYLYKLRATAATDLQHPLKGAQGADQGWGTLCSEKNWQNRSSDRYFQETISWAQFLHLLISRKALKSFTMTSAPCD